MPNTGYNIMIHIQEHFPSLQIAAKWKRTIQRQFVGRQRLDHTDLQSMHVPDIYRDPGSDTFLSPTSLPCHLFLHMKNVFKILPKQTSFVRTHYRRKLLIINDESQGKKQS